MQNNNSFHWVCHPKAENLLLKILGECTSRNETIAALEEDLQKYSSTRLFDWLDHLIVGRSSILEDELELLGFTCEQATSSYRVLVHLGAQLPRIIIRDHEDSGMGVAVKVDSIADFLMVRGRNGEIEGSPYAAYRRCLFSEENGCSLWIVERRSYQAMEPILNDPQTILNSVEVLEKWKLRPRQLEEEEEALSITLKIAEECVQMVGKDLAACLVLECERKYWQSRNQAGRFQKGRQDHLGMGWANHDHHTFRSSRRHFQSLVRLFEILGFHCRERFYAGVEAGWGAQVMENSSAGLVLFLDLDLAPHELEIDFVHHPLPELPRLGTVGLWCELHGDSILQAGMHHLEAQFFFDELTQDLSAHGIGMMAPFSQFSYLKQAFTHGDVWPVDLKRLEKLFQQKRITEEESLRFSKYGAVGSHLENLQRREGYKGFNQKNVSAIIEKTDPRNASF